MTDHLDPGPEFVERLVRLDERLRGGEVDTESLGNELTGALGPTTELADLWECVQILENHWPRRAKTIESAQARPNAVQLHPALSLALGSGDESRQFGKFVIKGELGRGGFGVVLLAEDTVLHRLVALKLPRPELLLDAAMKRRFLQEALAAAAIDHPHVAPIYEAGEIGALCYLAVAYCPGETLAAWLAQRAGPLPPRQAARIVETLALALQYIHEQGILHRDLKPGNVLLWPATAPAASDELPFVPKLTDFGLSKVLAESLAESRSSVLMGTPLYMSPEQAAGRLAEIGPATDIYALGVILYELLAGQPPFMGTSLAEVFDRVRQAEPPALRKQRSDLLRDLETICLKCLQKRPEDRYASALELAEDLRRFLEGNEIVARPTTWPARVYRWCQQSERLREAGMTVMAVNFIVAGWAFITFFVLAAGLIPRPATLTYADIGKQALGIIFGAHVPLGLVGAAVAARKSWAVYVSLGSGILMTAVAAGFALGLISPPASGIWNDTPGTRVLMYSMLTMLFLVQTVASAIAWIAMRAVR